MKKQIIITVCIFLAPLIFLTSCQKGSSVESISPSQLVTAFYQACKSGSYDLAKSYLSASSINYFDEQGKQDPDKSLKAFMDYCTTSLTVPELTNILVQGEKITNDKASVDTAFVYQKMEPSFVPHYLVKDPSGWHLDMVSTLEQLNNTPQEGIQKELANSGRWLKHPNYGNVWRPTEVGYNWQPYYQDGKFSSTKDGWEWESERSWGDKVFHYGRWTQAGPWGWVWVPGDTYAPSWVTWRANDEYVGWSPLGPGIDLDDKEKNFTPPSNAWVFLPTREFVEMVNSKDKVSYTKSRKPIKESSNIINTSTFYKGVNSYQGRLVNNGISTDFLEERSGLKITRRILSAPRAIQTTEEIFQNDRDRDRGRDRGRDRDYYREDRYRDGKGIPPGQAKKLERQYRDDYYDKHDRKREKEFEKHLRKEEKRYEREEKKHNREEKKHNKHKGKHGKWEDDD